VQVWHRSGGQVEQECNCHIVLIWSQTWCPGGCKPCWKGTRPPRHVSSTRKSEGKRWFHPCNARAARTCPVKNPASLVLPPT
jgi:hypothetical protein